MKIILIAWGWSWRFTKGFKRHGIGLGVLDMCTCVCVFTKNKIGKILERINLRYKQGAITPSITPSIFIRGHIFYMVPSHVHAFALLFLLALLLLSFSTSLLNSKQTIFNGNTAMAAKIRAQNACRTRRHGFENWGNISSETQKIVQKRKNGTNLSWRKWIHRLH